MDNKAKDHKSIAMRVSVVSMIINTILSIGKVAAGIIAGSGAMISDGVHSASDVFSTIIVIIGFNIAHKESDEKHQYGHERFECIAAIILAAILLATGIGIGLSGINKIIAGIEGNLAAPGSLALIAAVISIVVKEWMYWYTRAAAIKINSGALKADAWHHRSDALSSVGSFIGILGARIKFPILDPIASIIICLLCLLFKKEQNTSKERSNIQVRYQWNGTKKNVSHLKYIKTYFLYISMTMDVTNKQFQTMVDTAMEVGNANGQLETEVLNMMKVYANAGTTVEEINSQMKATVAFQNVSDLDANTATQSIQTIIQQYKLLEDGSMDAAEATEYLGDVMVAVSYNLAKGVSLTIFSI